MFLCSCSTLYRCAFAYEGKVLGDGQGGTDYNEMLELFTGKGRDKMSIAACESNVLSRSCA